MRWNDALVIACFAAALSMPSAAFALPDTDGDFVPDIADNCTTYPNGPNEFRAQLDCNGDGFGNRCDADYDNSLTTTTADWAVFLRYFGTSGSCQETDHDGSGATTISDGSLFVGKFQSRGAANAPGPSGLSCANTIPCRSYPRVTLNGGTSAADTVGFPNSVRSPSSYDVLTFEVPPGVPGEVALLEMEVGAPGGQCANGAHCYADGSYALAGWTSLAEAESSPTQGTLFHLDVTNLLTVVAIYGSSNGGVIGAPRFPTSLITFETNSLGATCPATGCVVALVSDVSAAPGLVVETRASSIAPGFGPTDHRLCPVGCEGGLAAGTASLRLIVAP
jgi:hypothetical protein